MTINQTFRCKIASGDVAAITPCVAVNALISAIIVCVNVVLVNVTAVSFISKTSFAVTVADLLGNPVTRCCGIASTIFKNYLT